MKTITYNRPVEVTGEYDVLVAGADLAGICAAVAAAREGSEWRFIERYGVVGGNLTTGYVGMCSCSAWSAKGTMRDEIVKILEIPDNDMIGETGKAHDFEKAKLTLSEFVNHPALMYIYRVRYMMS